jgi:hypothetical protein
MKSSKISITLAVGAACIVVGVSYLKYAYDGIPVRVKSYEREHIVARSVLRLSNFIFVHTNEGRVLFVDGKRHTRLMGGLPFFLEAPNKRTVVFVTEGDLRQHTNDVIHVYSFDSKREMNFSCEGFSFGSGIGVGRDRITSLDGEMITLQTERTSVNTIIKLDLRVGRVHSIENIDVSRNSQSRP